FCEIATAEPNTPLVVPRILRIFIPDKYGFGMERTKSLVGLDRLQKLVEQFDNRAARVGNRHATRLGQHANLSTQGFNCLDELHGARLTPRIEVTSRQRQQ